MTSVFAKLCIALQKRNVALPDYLQYLTFSETSDFEKFTQQLKKKKGALKDFYDYLEAQLISSVPPPSSPQSLFDSTSIQQVEKIGIHLLSLAKVDLETLNTLLKEIPPALLNHKVLLQKLFVQKKIKVQDFIDLEESRWTTIQSVPYQLRFRETVPEFFIKMNQEKPSQIGPYLLLEELGRGGMGIVYKGYHPGLNQTFAIKMMGGDENASETRLKRFHREIQTMAKLQHPGIIQIMASGQEENKHYFVMEYVDGEPLSRWLQKEFPLRDRLILFEKILKALNYAHEQGVIHRDLKPDNLFITKEGEPKIGDFGLAKDAFLELEDQKITQSGILLGTAHYMSPEQAAGEAKNVTVHTDIYAMGVCLYQLLTQKRPHEAGTLSLLLKKILQEDPLPPSVHSPGIHRDLDVILLKTLEKFPEKRYSSAKDFADDIRRFLDGYPILAKPSTWKDSSLKWFQRHKQWAILGILILGTFFSFWIVFYKTTLHNKKYQIQYCYDQAEKSLRMAQEI